MLSRRLGVAVVPISAKNRTGIEKLLTAAESAAKNEIRTTKVCYSPSCVKRTIDEVAKTIEAKAKDANLPLFHAATKLIEGDETPLSLSLLEREGINAAFKMERELGVDGAAAMPFSLFLYRRGRKAKRNRSDETLALPFLRP